MFYICPAVNKIARELLEGARSKNLIKEPGKPRTPIVKRARSMEEQRAIIYQGARENITKENFELNGNHFTLVDNTRSACEEIMVETVAHLAAILKRKHIGIWVDYHKYSDGRRQPVYTAWAWDQEFDFSKQKCALTEAEMKRVVFRLQFEMRKEELYLHNLRSNRPGVGGGMLAMLYNLAEKTGMKQIKYYVFEDNYKAKSFYIYNDFGIVLYEDDLGGEWMLKMPEIALLY